MSRLLAALVSTLVVLTACTDEKAPTTRPGATSSVAVASGSEAALAHSMARVLADGLKEGSQGRISSSQADCLVDEIAAHVRSSTLTDIASNEPDPKTLPSDVRASFGSAFDRCLPSDVARQLRQRFGV